MMDSEEGGCEGNDESGDEDDDEGTHEGWMIDSGGFGDWQTD